MKKIITVVVTHNSLESLKKCIESLRCQTQKPDAILVVNNGSADYTSVWLDKQADILHINQENSGTAGGFHTGLLEAYNLGYDWIWCMNDKSIPKEDALDEMMKENNLQTTLINSLVINKQDKKTLIYRRNQYQQTNQPGDELIHEMPIRASSYQPEMFIQGITCDQNIKAKLTHEMPITTSSYQPGMIIQGITCGKNVKTKLTHEIKFSIPTGDDNKGYNMWQKLKTISTHEINHPFNGTLIHRSIIERVGLPKKELFICGDGSEYFYRIVKQYGIPAKIATKSILYMSPVSFAQCEDWDYKSSWKMYYYVRNKLKVLQTKYQSKLWGTFVYFLFICYTLVMTLIFQKRDKFRKLNFILWPAADAFKGNYKVNPEVVIDKMNEQLFSSRIKILINPIKNRLYNWLIPSANEGVGTAAA